MINAFNLVNKYERFYSHNFAYQGSKLNILTVAPNSTSVYYVRPIYTTLFSSFVYTTPKIRFGRFGIFMGEDPSSINPELPKWNAAYLKKLIENNTTLKLPNEVTINYAKLFTFLANYKFHTEDGFYISSLMRQKLGRRVSGGIGKNRTDRKTRRGKNRTDRKTRRG